MPPSTSSEPFELREARLEKRERTVRQTIERLDFALTRFEAALGLPPWGEEARPKVALRLVPEEEEAGD